MPATALKLRAGCMTRGGGGAGDLTSWPRMTRCTNRSGASWRICAGRRNRLRAGAWRCIRMIPPPVSATRRVSAAICAHPKGALKAAMVEALRQHKPSRGRRRMTLAGTSMIPDSLKIIHRPEEIEARLVPGHWEGDLIKGAFNRSSVGTLVQRKTRSCRSVQFRRQAIDPVDRL